MSTVRITPELLATLVAGTYRVVEDGAPMGTRVTKVELVLIGDGGAPHDVRIHLDDGVDGERLPVIERLDAREEDDDG